jgi:hypothetical protein
MNRPFAAILLLVTLALGAGGVAVGTPLTPPGTPPSTVSRIISITPGSGSPMGSVLIQAVNVPDDKNKAEVWFTLAPNTPAQGTITKVAVSHGTMTYWVQVPGDDCLVTSYQGPLYIKIKEGGHVTNSVQFRIVPTTPKITSHYPQYGAPGRTTTFRGVNFKPTDEVVVSNAGALPLIYRSASEIAITLPANYPTKDKFIKVTVHRKNVSTAGSPMAYQYALDPSLLPPSKTGNTGQKAESGKGG